TWKFRMRSLLEREEQWDVVDQQKPEQVDAGYMAWKRNDIKAKATISLLCETAREMWQSLLEYHEKATIGNQVTVLRQVCFKNLSEGGDVEKHLEEFECLFERLVNAGVEFNELLRIVMMLRNLPPSYDGFVTALENRPQADLTLDLVIARLRDEHQKRSGLESYEKAMRVSERNDKKVCFYSNKPGHFKKNCRKFLAESKPKVKQAKAAEHGASSSKSKQPETTRELCFITENILPGAWIIDSGCSCHMTNDVEFFTNLKREFVGDVILADGRSAKSAGIGNGKIIVMDDKGSGCTIKTEEDVIVAVGELIGNQYKLSEMEKCLSVMENHSLNCQHTWRRRMGHRNITAINTMISKGLANGITIRDCGMRTVCECCLEGKLTRLPFPIVTERKSRKVMDLVHTDLCGPMEQPPPRGNKYFLTFIDDYSRFCTVFLIKSKDETAEKIQEYVRSCQNVFGRKPRVIRSDGGGEYTGFALQQFYKAEGIKAQFSTPYSPQSNGVAERKNRSLQEMARCMLLDAALPKRYWGEAVLTAAYLQNRLPSKSTDLTPYELWTGHKPDMSKLRVFGCQAFVHIPDEKRKKFHPKSKKMTFLGYSENHKGYRFVDVTSDRVTISRDAQFLELGNGSRRHEEDKDSATNDEYGEAIVEFSGQDEPTVEYGEADTSYEDAEENIQQDHHLEKTTRATRNVLPSRYDDFIVGKATQDEEPNDYRAAMSDPMWKKAMQDEILAHKVNQTWELVELPEGRKTIGAKWVFKLKRNEVGKVVRFKARIVAQGDSQKFGEDYKDVFAPVTRHTTLRAMMAVAAKKGLILKQYDVKTAYLNGTIEEELYMRQPPGFIVPGQEGLVCKLKKSIYGLKQSATCWNRALHEVLLKFNFEQCESDPCLYVRNKGGSAVYLLVYVDDLLIGSKEEAEINKIYENRREHFGITPLGAVKHFLGYEVERANSCYTLRLTSYIEQLIVEFGMKDAYPAKTPMDTGYTTLNEDSKPFTDKTKYRSLIGALLYLAINARPDLSLSVGLLGRKVENPNESDWAAAKSVLRYLKATKDYKLQYNRGSEWKLQGYTDADWAGDKESRKSSSGYVFFYGGGPVCWASKVQQVWHFAASREEMEAEYCALNEACQEITWQRHLLENMRENGSGPTIIYKNNQACISFAGLGKISRISKHIETKQYDTFRGLTHLNSSSVQQRPEQTELTKTLMQALETAEKTRGELNQTIKILNEQLQLQQKTIQKLIKQIKDSI
uniref:Integrase catalytic domain-containing protein n=1 Tax=Anopheles atroparvus TaxID=41427 RepID=A0AAG5DSQ9_ANOAO